MAYYYENSVNSYNGRAVDKPIDYSQYTAVTLDPEFGKNIRWMLVYVMFKF